jgi:heat shock protein HslJ
MEYMKGIIRACFLFIGIIAVGASAVSAQSNRLAGKRWTPTEINGKSLKDTRGFIEFEKNGDRFTGNGGCNRIFGAVTVTGSAMNFSGIGSTRMFCNGVMESETEFLNALRSVTRYRFQGNRLTLYSGNRTVLKLKGAPAGKTDPEPSKVGLENRKWLLVSIKGKSVGPLKEAAFLNFDPAKKSAGGNTSCNVFGGNYEASKDGKIRFTDTISTMRACIEDNRMVIERGFLDGLRDADRYVITADELELFKGPQLLLTFKGTAK